ncbi:hypothetical protein MPER_10147 [Moniliophthora perniciosa FA553]|nr:hypothetical protein MPER_10147 [Moniliophthora perniciosa FA553]
MFIYSADISDQEQVASALRRSGTTCIIHTASPPAGLSDPALYWKVNVDGTKAVIAAAMECGVKKLVFTSSAGVVFAGSDLIDVDERLPPPERPMDAYNESKAKAEEAVIAANGKNGLLTVALRPAVMAGLYRVFEDKKTHFQIGDNNRLFDWTYVGNVAHAHLLAADKEDTPPPAPPLGPLKKLPTEPPKLTEAELDLLTKPLSPIDLTIGRHRIPTSEARPLGPYVTPPPNAEKLVQAFEAPEGPSNHPVVRTRFDQLSENSIARAKLNDPEVHPLQVAGQAFFITNGEPCYFWDLPRIVWVWGWLSGKEPSLTRFKVTYSCVNRWHNIEKARRATNLKSVYQQGIDKMFEWWRSEYLGGTHKTKH